MSRHRKPPDEIGDARIVFDPEQPIVVIEGEVASEQVLNVLVDAWLTAVERIVTSRRTGAAHEMGLLVAHMDTGEFIASHRVAAEARSALRRAIPAPPPPEADAQTPDFAFVRFALARPQVLS
jgi:hypothetical protein